MKFIANFVTNLAKYMYELNIQNCRPLGNIYLQASIKKNLRNVNVLTTMHGSICIYNVHVFIQKILHGFRLCSFYEYVISASTNYYLPHSKKKRITKMNKYP